MRTHHGEVVSVQMREDEEEQENPFGCSKLFAQVGDLKNHMETHNGEVETVEDKSGSSEDEEEQERTFGRKECSKSFSQAEDLKKHI